MMTDVKVVAAWCRSVVSFDARLGIPESTTNLRLDAIERCSDSPRIYEVARELATAISHCSASEQAEIRGYLISEYGFSYEFFTDRNKKAIVSVIKRGVIKTDAEYRMIHEFMADAELNQDVALKCDAMLAKYDASRK